MSSYKENQWKIFRQSVIELDGYRCMQCLRGQDEVILQVHHKQYKKGLKLWEYATVKRNPYQTNCKVIDG